MPRKKKTTDLVKTWGQIKQQVEARGVRDDTPVFLIDIGPGVEDVCVNIDRVGAEIADDPVLVME